MALGEQVKLIEYKKSVDTLNSITHVIGAAFGTAGMVLSVIKTAHSGLRAVACAVVYCLSLIAVYLISALYHGLPQGEAKRKARLLDHSTVPLLIAGTATPCSMITLYRLNVGTAAAVFCIGWFCVLFGVFAKVFFFEKLKKAVMAVYIIGGVIMLALVIPFLGGSEINTHAYVMLLEGCLFYIIGALFCAWGIKREEMHVVFHLFVLAGSIMHFYVIYRYILF